MPDDKAPMRWDERELQVETEKRYQTVITKKREALKEIFRLQARVAELDEEIEKIAEAGPSALCHW